MRKLFVGGNWKSNLTLSQAKSLVLDVYNKLAFDTNKLDVIASPVNLHLSSIQQTLQSNVQLSAQNVSLYGMGAYTGEVNIEQLKDLQIHWAIIGHSERRSIFGESNETVGKKVARALKNNLKVIGCIGEQLSERESNQTFNVVKSQLDAFKNELTEQDWKEIVIAYEPVWAIGTGKVASPDQAQEVHAFIRNYLKENVSLNVSDSTRIIYGGSVTDKNCKELIGKPDIDGFLVGGASLKPDFTAIVNACNISK